MTEFCGSCQQHVPSLRRHQCPSARLGQYTQLDDELLPDDGHVSMGPSGVPTALQTAGMQSGACSMDADIAAADVPSPTAADTPDVQLAQQCEGQQHAQSPVAQAAQAGSADAPASAPQRVGEAVQRGVRTAMGGDVLDVSPADLANALALHSTQGFSGRQRKRVLRAMAIWTAAVEQAVLRGERNLVACLPTALRYKQLREALVEQYGTRYVRYVLRLLRPTGFGAKADASAGYVELDVFARLPPEVMSASCNAVLPEGVSYRFGPPEQFAADDGRVADCMQGSFYKEAFEVSSRRGSQ